MAAEEGGQTRPGHLSAPSANPKTQPSSLPPGGQVAFTDAESHDGVISDNYPETSMQNMTNRVRPEVTGQNERGWVQTDAGNVPTRDTSANRVRKIPNP